MTEAPITSRRGKPSVTRFRALLKQYGITGTSVAQRLHYHGNYVQHILGGLFVPSRSFIERACADEFLKSLGVTEELFYEPAPAPEQRSSGEQGEEAQP